MSVKNPIVLYNGKLSELASGDTINGASSVFALNIKTGTVTINFGSSPGTNFITTTISDTSVSSNKNIQLVFLGSDFTSSHNSYEHILANKLINLSVTNIIDNTSFDIVAVTELRLTGTFKVTYVLTDNTASTANLSGFNVGANIARMADLPANPSGFQNYQFKSRIFGSKIVNNASKIKIRFIGNTTASDFTINGIVVKRTNRNSLTVLDTTTVSIGGLTTGINITSAGSGIDTVVLTDAINITIDQFHDYYFYVYFANTSNNNSLSIYSGSSTDGDIFGIASTGSQLGETTISGSFTSNMSLIDSIIVA